MPGMHVMMLRWRIFQLHYIKEGGGQLWLKRGRVGNRHIRHHQEQGQDGDDHVVRQFTVYLQSDGSFAKLLFSDAVPKF